MTMSFDALSNEEMADEITTWAGRIAAGEARLIALIGEFDRREAWVGVGLLSCATWLSWRLGMGLKAAHERVRVGRALHDLPVTAAEFMAGRLSWTQVRAITRVATPADEHTYVELARHASGAQLERLVRGVRRAQRILEDEADPEAAAHRMRTRVSYDADGTLVLSIRLPAEDGAIVLAALEQARADLDQRAKRPADSAPPTCAQPSSAEESPAATTTAAATPATLAQAMMHLARESLATAAAERPRAASRHRPRLVAHIDPLSGWARLHDGEFLPPTSVTSVEPPAPGPLRPLRAADLTRHDLGRSARLADEPLRALLGCIDGERCHYPGCTRRRRLHAHHVLPWSAGGPTDLANLVLVCGRHHTLIHEKGFQLTLRADRRLTVCTADGTPVPHRHEPPWQPAAHLDRPQLITATTLPPAACDRLHLGYAVAVMMQQAA